jgi:DNA-binding PadR family transcriptional regulator
MPEAWVLSLVERYPHRVALARHVRDGSVFAVLRQLEARGLLRCRQDHYRLTRSGRDELAWTRVLARLMNASRA